MITSNHTYFKFFITLHGFPAATQSAGMLFVTTLPAPIILRPNCDSLENDRMSTYPNIPLLQLEQISFHHWMYVEPNSLKDEHPYQ